MWPHRQQPTRLPHPWDSPGKNTGVGCHFLLQCVKVKSESEVAQSCPTLSDPMDCSPPGSSIHGILQARVLEWGAIAFSNTITGLPEISLLQESCYLTSEDSRVLQVESMPLIKICCTVLNIRRNYNDLHVTSVIIHLLICLCTQLPMLKRMQPNGKHFQKNQTSPIKRKKRKNENVSDKA